MSSPCSACTTKFDILMNVAERTCFAIAINERGVAGSILAICSTPAMIWIANFLLLMGSGLGTLFVLTHTDASFHSTEYQRQTVAILAVIYFAAAVVAAAYDLAAK